MQNRTIIIGLLITHVLAFGSGSGCGEGSSSPDGPAPDTEPFESDCGFPGDQGNELGIGKFCDSQSDCVEANLPFCSTLGDPNTHFCTKLCDMGSTDQCGTATECTCNGNNQCGCTPSVCLGN
ncbi:MAG: hypothetical protein H0V17_11200 [Deltaproteobacteria bacterium]|nr:hypothetical protein [Deltaproteobacteria bacterium]